MDELFLYLTNGSRIAQIVTVLLLLWIKFNDLAHVEKRLDTNDNEHKQMNENLNQIIGSLKK